MATDYTYTISVDATSGSAGSTVSPSDTKLQEGDRVRFQADPKYSGDIVIVCPNDSPFVDLFPWEYVKLPSRTYTLKSIQGTYQVDCGHWNQQISAGPPPGTTRGPHPAFVRWLGGVNTPRGT